MQKTYNNLVSNTSCADLVGTLESLDCLRDAPFEELNHALNVSAVGPWPPVLDNDFIQDYVVNQFSKGNFVRVPLLIGTNSDEGTALSRPVNTDAEMRAAIAAWPLAETVDKTVEQLVDELMYLYPNIQSLGVPSLETWPHVIQRNDSFAQTLGLQYRRGAALFGDIAMHYHRRRGNLAWDQHRVKNYAYRFNVVVNGVDNFSGATHFQEVSPTTYKLCHWYMLTVGQVAFVFLNVNGDGYPINPFGGNGTYPAKAKALAKEMSTAWINFFHGLDPNGDAGLDGGEEWPAYDTSVGGGAGQDFVFDLDADFVEMDDWRAEGINWMIENSLAVFGD